MVTSNNKTPESVVKPLALIDLKQNDQNMKCLVTEWAKADEQIINQFVSFSTAIDGYIIGLLFAHIIYVHLRLFID